jgi:hypothetical protein
MPDCVYTAMNAMQAVCRDAIRPAALANPGLVELRERDNSVLVRR